MTLKTMQLLPCPIFIRYKKPEVLILSLNRVIAERNLLNNRKCFLRSLGTGSINRDEVFTIKLVILTEIPKTIYSHTIKIGVAQGMSSRIWVLFHCSSHITRFV